MTFHARHTIRHSAAFAVIAGALAFLSGCGTGAPPSGKVVEETAPPRVMPPAPPPPSTVAPALADAAGVFNRAPSRESLYSVAPPRRENTERYPDATPNPVKLAAEVPVSTFSVDVDTASYGNVRRYLQEG